MLNLLVCHRQEAPIFRYKLSYQPIRIFIRSPLPTGIRISKIRFCPQSHINTSKGSKLPAIVYSDSLCLFLIRAQQM